MSHNPNTVKSQDDTAEDELGRTMTLLRAIEQLEKTECELEKVEKQLDIALDYLATYKQHGTGWVKVWALECEQNIEELNK